MATREASRQRRSSDKQQFLGEIRKNLRAAIEAVEQVSEKLESPYVPWSRQRATVFLAQLEGVSAVLLNMDRFTSDGQWTPV